MNNIGPAKLKCKPALKRGGMVSMATLMARKLEPLITQSEIKINHILVWRFRFIFF
ncbi:MAG TPA: hypothetical protein VJL78_07665 [Candidatus Nitrosocosmicus sp.]|nr:hypothetical protein [Candidatus Nitrosocosmicus sp.]